MPALKADALAGHAVACRGVGNWRTCKLSGQYPSSRPWSGADRAAGDRTELLDEHRYCGGLALGHHVACPGRVRRPGAGPGLPAHDHPSKPIEPWGQVEWGEQRLSGDEPSSNRTLRVRTSDSGSSGRVSWCASVRSSRRLAGLRPERRGPQVSATVVGGFIGRQRATMFTGTSLSNLGARPPWAVRLLAAALHAGFLRRSCPSWSNAGAGHFGVLGCCAARRPDHGPATRVWPLCSGLRHSWRRSFRSQCGGGLGGGCPAGGEQRAYGGDGQAG